MATDAPNNDNPASRTLQGLLAEAVGYATPHERSWISDAVNGVLAAAGLGIEYDDRFGVDLVEVIQPALELAAMRSPELANLFHSIQVDHEKASQVDDLPFDGTDCNLCKRLRGQLFSAERHNSTARTRGIMGEIAACEARGHLTLVAYNELNSTCRDVHPDSLGSVIPYSFNPSNHEDGRTRCTCACHPQANLVECGACGWRKPQSTVNHDATRIEEL